MLDFNLFNGKHSLDECKVCSDIRVDKKSTFLSRQKLFYEQKSQISQISQVYGKISQKHSARNFQI